MFLAESKSRKEKKGYESEIEYLDGINRAPTMVKGRGENDTKSILNTWEDCQCGQNYLGSEISGGTEAVPHEFPWMVRIIGGCKGGELQVGIFQGIVEKLRFFFA